MQRTACLHTSTRMDESTRVPFPKMTVDRLTETYRRTFLLDLQVKKVGQTQ